MPKIQDNILVNATGGALVSLSATLWARKVVIMEDPINGSAAGIVYTLPDDNFVAQHKLQAGEVLTLGDSVAQGNGKGPVVGRPAQVDSGSLTGTSVATVYAKLVSIGAATRVRMTEVE